MEFLKLSRVKILNILLLSALICGCNTLDPYVDRRRNPGTSDISKLYTGRSKIDAPAICYNPLLSNMEKLQTMADEECTKHNTGTHAEFINKEEFSCKLLLPTTAFYKCVK